MRNIRKYLNFLKENLIISFKTLIEYKADFYSILISNLIEIIIMFSFFSIIITNFSNIFEWTIIDFILYYLLFKVITSIAGIFLWQQTLFIEITKGNFNLLLTKPINIFWIFHLKNIPGIAFFEIILNLSLFTIVLYYFNLIISTSQMIIFSSLTVLTIFFFLFFYLFIFSLDFIHLGLGDSLFNPVNKIVYFFLKYPSIFFKSFKYNSLLFLIPTFFIGSLLIPSLRNYQIYFFYEQIIFLIIINLLLIFLTYRNWKKGIKNYQAFG